LEQHKNCPLRTQKSSSQENSTVPVADGTNKIEADKTWNNFKIHFSAAYRQHRQMQGETVGSQGFTNAAVTQASEDDLAEQALGAFANFAT
jgi:hypothetical protein